MFYDFLSRALELIGSATWLFWAKTQLEAKGNYSLLFGGKAMY